MTPAAVNSAAVRGSTAVRSPVPGLGVSEEEPLGAREESSPDVYKRQDSNTGGGGNLCGAGYLMDCIRMWRQL